MTLDIRTLSFTVSLVSFNATIIMVLLSILVKQYRATIYWAVGNGLNALGFGLIVFRGQIPDVFSIVSANLLCAVSMGFSYFGILNFSNSERKIPPFFWLIFLLLPPFVYFSRIQDSLLYRSLITAIFGASMMFLSGLTLILKTPKKLKFSYWFAGAAFIGMGIFQTFRGISLFWVNTSYGIFSQNWLQIYHFIFLVAFIVLWTMGSVFMVTQRLSIELKETARIDFLTQTLNRRAGQERLNQEAKRAERNNGVFSIILMDIDKFKYVNDHYGHSTGDAALVQISDMMRKNLRVEDMHCRWGGDEFLIMLQDTAEAGALEVAERLKTTIHKQKVVFQQKRIGFTLSIGIASFGGTTRTLEEIISLADEALYSAKAKGGDCILVESAKKDQLALL